MTDAPLHLILEGKYLQALEHVQGLSSPTPRDERWAGVCLLNLGRPLEARAVLMRAKGRGCAPAAIELTTTARLMGDLVRAQGHLARLDLAALGAFDRALAERERGVLRFAQGDLPGARDALEQAWEAAAASPHEQALLPGICQTIAYVCLDQGASSTALHYIGHALPYAHPAKRVALLTLQGACHLFEGDFELAGTCLAEAEAAVTLAPQQRPTLLYYQGMLYRYVGQPAKASALFHACTAASREVQALSTECYAELGACALCAECGDFAQAHLHLARAQAITGSSRLQTVIDLRASQVLIQDAPERAQTLLREVYAQLQALGLHREAGWASLQLARAAQVLGDETGLRGALRLAAQCRAATGDSRAVALELRATPELVPALEAAGPAGQLFLSDWQAMTGATPLHLNITALGAPSLVLDRVTVRPNASLARSVELLVYLTLKGGASLERVLTDVFPDRDPQSARVYFHLIRAELARIAPGLKIVFQRESRQYELETCGVRVTVDHLEVRRELTAGGIDGVTRALALYRGPLLPDSDSEWVREERDDLEWSMVRVGLELVEEYFERGEDQLCLDLAGRLLDIEPFNEAIHTFLIRATERLSGTIAARQAMARSQAQFRDHVGEVPLTLKQLQITMQA
ncbi:BTAD domain-containing putative transcriptional regulator [Deinococcus depolymerans]|uniref:Bacterial transcriptional activator domain-containing protein n=1 Tax=Deinococcus depolymerans TaxID=392408 RepID=A0ABP3LHU7_9DEIO